jgi:hypothetical protein
MKRTQLKLYCVCILQVVVQNYELTILKVKKKGCVILEVCAETRCVRHGDRITKCFYTFSRETRR